MPPPDDSGASVGLSASVVVDDEVHQALVAGLHRARVIAPATLVPTVGLALVVAVAVGLDQGPAVGVVGALVVLGIVVLLTRAMTRTRVLGGYAVGSTLGVGLGALDGGVIRLDTGPLVEVLDLSLFTGVTVHRDAVVLRLRAGGVSALPRVLVTEADLDRLRTAVEAVGAPAAEGPQASARLPWAHTITTADEEARRRRLLHVARHARRSTYGLVLGAAVVAVGLTRSPWPLAIVVVIAVQDLLDRRRVGSVGGLVLAAGTPVRAGIVEERLVVQTPRALLSRPLDRLVEVSEEDGLVLLTWDLPSRETQYPSNLLGSTAVVALRAAI